MTNHTLICRENKPGQPQGKLSGAFMDFPGFMEYLDFRSATDDQLTGLLVLVDELSGVYLDMLLAWMDGNLFYIEGRNGPVWHISQQ